MRRYCVRWYARNGTIREAYFQRLRDAREEAKHHRDAEVYEQEKIATNEQTWGERLREANNGN